MDCKGVNGFVAVNSGEVGTITCKTGVGLGVTTWIKGAALVGVIIAWVDNTFAGAVTAELDASVGVTTAELTVIVTCLEASPPWLRAIKV